MEVYPTIEEDTPTTVYAVKGAENNTYFWFQDLDDMEREMGHRDHTKLQVTYKTIKDAES